MPDYTQGKIYSICSKETEDIYIGSTCCSLAQRLAKHKQDYKNWKEGKRHFTTSFNIIKYPDCYIELLEDYPCERVEQLNRKEGEHMKRTKCVNRCVAGRTKAEYRTDKKEMLNGKHMCTICNVQYTYRNKARHFKSVAHQKNSEDEGNVVNG